MIETAIMILVILITVSLALYLLLLDKSYRQQEEAIRLLKKMQIEQIKGIKPPSLEESGKEFNKWFDCCLFIQPSKLEGFRVPNS